jgi:hypothetical protein
VPEILLQYAGRFTVKFPVSNSVITLFDWRFEKVNVVVAEIVLVKIAAALQSTSEAATAPLFLSDELSLS